MKKLVLAVTLLVSIFTMSLPVTAASPTASEALTPGVLGSRRAPGDVTAETLAAELLSSGAVDTQAAATAVAESLLAIKAMKCDEEGLLKLCAYIYKQMTDEQKAKIDEAAAKRGISVEEVIGNIIASNTAFPGSVAVAWNEELSKSSIDGKAGSINFILTKPDEEAVASGTKDANGNTVLSIFDFTLQGGHSFKTLDTAICVKGIKDTDTADTIIAKQLVNGKWNNVKITAFTNDGLALHLTNKGPIKIEKVK
jgi:hypothetical protein